jgi:hypothetical protein
MRQYLERLISYIVFFFNEKNILYAEEFEDTKRANRISKKNRQHNDQKKK